MKCSDFYSQFSTINTRLFCFSSCFSSVCHLFMLRFIFLKMFTYVMCGTKSDGALDCLLFNKYMVSIVPSVLESTGSLRE